MILYVYQKDKRGGVKMTTGDILGYVFWGIVITAPFWIAYAATVAGDWLANRRG